MLYLLSLLGCSTYLRRRTAHAAVQVQLHNPVEGRPREMARRCCSEGGQHRCSLAMAAKVLGKFRQLPVIVDVLCLACNCGGKESS